MNPKLKAILINSAKQAVNAVLTNAGLMTMFSQTFNFHDPAHALNLLKAAGAAIVAREATIWLPKLLAWSQTTLTSLML